jgi:hypothetical protein
LLLHFYQSFFSPPAICLLHNESSLVCLLIELQAHFCLEWNSLVAGETNYSQGTEVPFATFLSGGFTTMAVINPLETKLTKRTSVQG